MTCLPSKEFCDEELFHHHAKEMQMGGRHRRRRRRSAVTIPAAQTLNVVGSGTPEKEYWKLRLEPTGSQLAPESKLRSDWVAGMVVKTLPGSPAALLVRYQRGKLGL